MGRTYKDKPDKYRKQHSDFNKKSKKHHHHNFDDLPEPIDEINNDPSNDDQYSLMDLGVDL